MSLTNSTVYSKDWSDCEETLLICFMYNATPSPLEAAVSPQPKLPRLFSVDMTTPLVLYWRRVPPCPNISTSTPSVSELLGPGHSARHCRSTARSIKLLHKINYPSLHHWSRHSNFYFPGTYPSSSSPNSSHMFNVPPHVPQPLLGPRATFGTLVLSPPKIGTESNQIMQSLWQIAIAISWKMFFRLVFTFMSGNGNKNMRNRNIKLYKYASVKL